MASPPTTPDSTRPTPPGDVPPSSSSLSEGNAVTRVPPAPSEDLHSAQTLAEGGPTETMPLSAAGYTVPGYEVLDLLGEGGMGVVFKARQVGLNRLVALKMIRTPGPLGRDRLARFRTEAEAIGRLDHPGIVRIYEVGEFAGRPFCPLALDGGG